MAGWLGSNFTAQLDQIKKGVTQVSSIVKDTLVVDETWDEDDPDRDQGDEDNQDAAYSRRECWLENVNAWRNFTR